MDLYYVVLKIRKIRTLSLTWSLTVFLTNKYKKYIKWTKILGIGIPWWTVDWWTWGRKIASLGLISFYDRCYGGQEKEWHWQRWRRVHGLMDPEIPAVTKFISNRENPFQSKRLCLLWEVWIVTPIFLWRKNRWIKSCVREECWRRIWANHTTEKLTTDRHPYLRLLEQTGKGRDGMIGARWVGMHFLE